MPPQIIARRLRLAIDNTAKVGGEDLAFNEFVAAKENLDAAKNSHAWYAANTGDDSVYTQTAADRVMRAKTAFEAAGLRWLAITSGDDDKTVAS